MTSPDEHTMYELTPEQIAEGWTVEITQYSVIYKNPKGNVHDPAPGVPAWQEWYYNKGSVKLSSGYFYNGVFHDPAPGVPATTSWRANGTRSSMTHYRHGKVTSYKRWDERGEAMMNRELDMLL